MSEWDKAKGDYKKEFRNMEKEIKGYSYKNPEKAESTDGKFRGILSEEVGKSRDFLFPIIEKSYIEGDLDDASAMEDAMQWLDVFMLELGLPLAWNDEAVRKDFARLIRLDFSLLNDTKKLADVFRDMQKRWLSGKGGSADKKSASIKKFITELLTLFKRRRHSLGG
jgi:hypothetical protein